MYICKYSVCSFVALLFTFWKLSVNITLRTFLRIFFVQYLFLSAFLIFFLFHLSFLFHQLSSPLLSVSLPFTTFLSLVPLSCDSYSFSFLVFISFFHIAADSIIPTLLSKLPDLFVSFVSLVCYLLLWFSFFPLVSKHISYFPPFTPSIYSPHLKVAHHYFVCIMYICYKLFVY